MKRPAFLGAIAAGAGMPLAALGAQGAPELIVTGATIHTGLIGATPIAAFAVRAGRIMATGSRDRILAMRGAATRVLDLTGHTVLPGLIDAHLHLLAVGVALEEVDCYFAPSYADVIQRTVAFAKTSPDLWIHGEGWDQNRWDGNFPTHDALSAALPDRPVVLGRVDGHALLANARAMQIAGVTAATADPPGGRIVRTGEGTPTGVFIDSARALIDRVVPPLSDAQRRRAITSAMHECHRFGLTTITEPGVDAAGLAAYEALLGAGAFSLRNYVMLADEPSLLAEHFAAGPRSAAYDGRLWVRAVKMYADGALGSRGAALLAPYSDDPQNRGLLRADPAHLQDVCERALRAGFQTCVHAIGDRGNRVVLDAYTAALRAVPTNNPRLRIEHAQVLDPADIPRFAQLGVIPSMQTTHETSDSPWAQTRLGPDRIRGAYAWRSLLDTGVHIANGTDAPVEAVNTLRTFHASISRQNEANLPAAGWYPAQRMTRAEALASMTVWAAEANFQEHDTGALLPGRFADFVVMDRDWMTAPAETIMQTEILATYSAGRAVYERPIYAAAMTAPHARRSRRVATCGCAHPHPQHVEGPTA